jgi:hypothetical protein
MEASMHGSPDGSGRTTEDSFFQRWGIGFLVLPILVLVTLIGLTVVQPATTNWIADEAMAEFTGANYGPHAVPTQLAKAAR